MRPVEAVAQIGASHAYPADRLVQRPHPAQSTVWPVWVLKPRKGPKFLIPGALNPEPPKEERDDEKEERDDERE